MLRFDKVTYLLLLFKFFLYESLSNSLRGSDILLFPDFINTVSILFYHFIELITFLYTYSYCYIDMLYCYLFCLIQRIYNFCDFI